MELYIWRSFSNGSNGTAASVAVMLLGMASVLIGLSLWVRRAGDRRMRTTARGRRRRRALAARVPDHHLSRRALPALVHRRDGDQVERRLSARPDRLPDATRRSARCARCSSHQPLPRWMWNSFLVTVSSVAVSTFIALLAAYAAVFGRFRGHTDLPLDERRADGRAAGDAARADVHLHGRHRLRQPPAVGDHLLHRPAGAVRGLLHDRTSSARSRRS